MPIKHMNMQKIFPRGPNLRGKFMMDVSQGKERVRAWPKNRGKRQSEAQKFWVDWFRQAQWMSKYIDPKEQLVCTIARSGTPLLPRDVMTMIMANRMFMFTTTEGKRYYPMPARADVSASLDVLSYIEGTLLYRGPDFWEPVGPGLNTQVLTSRGAGNAPEFAGLPAATGGWTLIDAGNVPVGQSSITWTAALTGFKAFAFVARQVTASVSTRRDLTGSVDGGANVLVSSLLDAAGVETGGNVLLFHATDSAAARTIVGLITGNITGGNLQMTYPNGWGVSVTLPNPLNWMRYRVRAGTFTGGTYALYGQS